MQQPSFDTWTTIFLFAAIQGIFVSTVLCFAQKRNRYNNILVALLIFLFSVTLIEYVLYWTRYMGLFPHTMDMSGGFPFLFGVILFFYFRNVFGQKRLSSKDWRHLLPFIIYFIAMFPQYASSAEVKGKWMHGSSARPSLFHWPHWVQELSPVWPWLKIVHMCIYAGMIYYLYNGISKTNPEVRTWFKWLTGLFAAFILSFTSYYVLVNFSFFNSQWDYMISFSMMFFIYFIAWFGYLQPKVFSGLTLTESVKSNERYKNSALTTDTSAELMVQLEKIMAEKKLYRQSDLRLEKLAGEMNVSRHHLSQIINEQGEMNFFEYINRLRIRDAQELLSQKSKKELNVIDVAYIVGFNNKVSFNTTFKKMTGITPTEFRKNHEEKTASQSIQ
ncbi:MAG: helix-turn-helix domain-containing protein [Bacteroidota bacterium]